MPTSVKHVTVRNVEEDRERILHSIAERWHGDLTAYLEAITRVRNEAVHETNELLDQEAEHPFFALYRRR